MAAPTALALEKLHRADLPITGNSPQTEPGMNVVLWRRSDPSRRSSLTMAPTWRRGPDAR